MLTPSLLDLQARNVHLRLEEDSILEEFEAAELRTPSPRKVDGDRIIYESRGLKRPKRPGRPVLCDFGEARFGKKTYTDDIQPYVYRAPEIILDIPWTYSVDIWNVGVMVSVVNVTLWSSLAHSNWTVIIDLGHLREQAPIQCSGWGRQKLKPASHG